MGPSRPTASHPGLALPQSCSDIPNASIVVPIDHANTILLLKPGNLWCHVGCAVLAATVGVSAPHTVNLWDIQRGLVFVRFCQAGAKQRGYGVSRYWRSSPKPTSSCHRELLRRMRLSMKRAIGLEARPLLGAVKRMLLAYRPLPAGRPRQKMNWFGPSRFSTGQ
jgi:hypothetical protein